ncbi:hypothetical protein F4777DRAFT_577183 [Nemania sp. FL0916]|nr:hypothetical protein F4777DRAFT_577183 [Nemania sp. FL0916]
MLPSTVRRLAAAAAPQTPLLASFAPTATRATAALCLRGNPRSNQQRRYSSSKPSSPKDSPNLAAGQVAASPTQSTKQGTEKRRRKAKDASSSSSSSASAQRKLPSVPSTQDLPEEALALATFFSLHRPISVTHSFPKAITADAFAQIFAPRSRSTQTKLVSTLARPPNQSEQPPPGLTITAEYAAGNGGGHEPVRKISLKHSDGTETSMNVELDHMSGPFLPFKPPPIPQPVASSDAGAEAGSETALQQTDEAAIKHEPQTRIYKAMFTLEESIDEDGNTRIVAHPPQFIEDETTSDAATGATQAHPSYQERVALRRVKREQVSGQANSMLAISTKRRRALRMKKKKYKKLMKRTRNERRKLDRI